MHLPSPAMAGDELSRDRGGRFRKGVSGNPKGGTKGARRLIAQHLDKLAESEAEAVFMKVCEQARAGDLDAAKIVLARAWPVRRGRPLHLTLPKLSDAHSAAALSEAALHAVTSGELTPEEGEALSKVVSTHIATVQQHDIEARLAAIEDERQQSRAPVPRLVA